MNRATRMTLAMLCVSSLAGCHSDQPLLAGGKPVGHWIERSRDSDDKVRREAIAKLGNVGNADPAVLPALIVALKDKNPAVRREAIIGIVKYGTGSSEAHESLKAIQASDPDSNVRDLAARAIEKVGREPNR
jgi:HEAT repeat protein